MIFRIAGGVFFVCLALGYFSIVVIPVFFLGLLATVAGVALLAGA